MTLDSLGVKRAKPSQTLLSCSKQLSNDRNYTYHSSDSELKQGSKSEMVTKNSCKSEMVTQNSCKTMPPPQQYFVLVLVFLVFHVFSKELLMLMNV